VIEVGFELKASLAIVSINNVPITAAIEAQRPEMTLGLIEFIIQNI